MTLNALILKLMQEIARANAASGSQAKTLHGAITDLITAASAEAPSPVVTGRFQVKDNSTKSVVHNTGWTRYLLLARLEGSPTADYNEYRTVFTVAYVDTAGAGVPPTAESNTFFGAQRRNSVSGACSTTANTLSSSTSNVCSCCSNALAQGSYRWVCINLEGVEA